MGVATLQRVRFAQTRAFGHNDVCTEKVIVLVYLWAKYIQKAKTPTPIYSKRSIYLPPRGANAFRVITR